jgi:hypothetical protein
LRQPGDGSRSFGVSLFQRQPQTPNLEEGNDVSHHGHHRPRVLVTGAKRGLGQALVRGSLEARCEAGLYPERASDWLTRTETAARRGRGAAGATRHPGQCDVPEHTHLRGPLIRPRAGGMRRELAWGSRALTPCSGQSGSGLNGPAGLSGELQCPADRMSRAQGFRSPGLPPGTSESSATPAAAQARPALHPAATSVGK